MKFYKKKDQVTKQQDIDRYRFKNKTTGNKRTLEPTPEIEKWINFTSWLLDEKRFEFASDTISGIYDWITENQQITPGQVRALQNIYLSVFGRDASIYYDWERLYEK